VKTENFSSEDGNLNEISDKQLGWMADCFTAPPSPNHNTLRLEAKSLFSVLKETPPLAPSPCPENASD
jgi:hypothetical protein